MQTRTEVLEITGIPCVDCEGVGFVMLWNNGDVELLNCECGNDQFTLFGDESD